MKFLNTDDAIIACSTGRTSNAALGVIRINSPAPLDFLNDFFSIDLKKIKPKTVMVSNILNSNEVLDQAVITYFKAPESFTGEYVLELSLHGNQINIDRVLNHFLDNSKVRLAENGEFTYRALKNKKMDIAQVEGLDLLLNANSPLMLDQGLELLQGDLHNQYQKLYERFLNFKSTFEIGVDFGDDIGEEQYLKLRKSSWNDFMEVLGELHKRVVVDHTLIKDPKIILVGQTNAGKSSFFNYLLGNNRAIVSNIAGTTRDYISERIRIENINYDLVDTAGLRDNSTDEIETRGMELTLELMKKSFFKILLVNPFETDIKWFDSLKNEEFDFLFVTHFDHDNCEEKFQSIKHALPNAYSGAFIDLNTGSIGPSLSLSKSGSIEPLTLEGQVLSKFQSLIKDKPILIDRHRLSIKSIYKESTEYQLLMDSESDIGILSNELETLSSDVSELIGVFSPEGVLNNIFSNFCIGK